MRLDRDAHAVLARERGGLGPVREHTLVPLPVERLGVVVRPGAGDPARALRALRLARAAGERDHGRDARAPRASRTVSRKLAVGRARDRLVGVERVARGRRAPRSRGRARSAAVAIRAGAARSSRSRPPRTLPPARRRAPRSSVRSWKSARKSPIFTAAPAGARRPSARSRASPRGSSGCPRPMISGGVPSSDGDARSSWSTPSRSTAGEHRQRHPLRASSRSAARCTAPRSASSTPPVQVARAFCR